MLTNCSILCINSRLDAKYLTRTIKAATSTFMNCLFIDSSALITKPKRALNESSNDILENLCACLCVLCVCVCVKHNLYMPNILSNIQTNLWTISGYHCDQCDGIQHHFCITFCNLCMYCCNIFNLFTPKIENF